MPRQDLRSRLQVQLAQVAGSLQEVMLLPEAGPWLDILEAVRKLLMVLIVIDQEKTELPVDTAPGEERDQRNQTLERRLG